MLLVLASLLTPPAAACQFVVGAEHVVTENPADTAAPTDPADVQVTVKRGVGPACVGPLCSSTSCDDLGAVTLTFPASTDDVSAPEAIGYRVRLVEGTAPEHLLDGVVRTSDRLSDDGTAQITLAWGDEATDDQEPLDFVLGVTAIDEAGNESAEVEVEVSDAGSGCATVGGAGALATLLALGLAGARRRRG